MTYDAFLLAHTETRNVTVGSYSGKISKEIYLHNDKIIPDAIYFHGQLLLLFYVHW